MMIDSHCHLNDLRFGSQQQQLIDHAIAAGVTTIVVPAADPADWPLLGQLSDRFDTLHTAFGIHPWYCADADQTTLDRLRQMIEQHPVVAIGECGLDFDRRRLQHAPAEQQQRIFQQQIDLARESQLPLIIHSHKSLDQVTRMLRQANASRGVVHRFSGSLQQAQRLIDLGFYIGVAAAITYPAQQRLRKTLAQLPVERLLLESDAPDLPPATHLGQLNRPEYLPEILASLAGLLRIPTAVLAEQTTRNSTALFGL